MLSKLKITLVFVLGVMALITLPFWGWIYASIFNDATNDSTLNLGLVTGTEYELRQDVFIYSYSEPSQLKTENEKISISDWKETNGVIRNDRYQYITGVLPKGTILSYLNAEKEHHWNGGMSVLFYASATYSGKTSIYLINAVLEGIEGSDSNEYVQKI